jgi:hypothetical protein
MERLGKKNKNPVPEAADAMGDGLDTSPYSTHDGLSGPGASSSA